MSLTGSGGAGGGNTLSTLLGAISAGTYTGATIGPGAIQGTIPSGIAWTHSSITGEETKELDILEEEHKAFVRINRTKKFQALPRHLRQEIVDEAILKDLIEDLASNDDKDFEHTQRLHTLRAKKNHYGNVHISGVTSVFGYTAWQSKYADIIKHFTTKELSEAHAQTCLEEDIQS